MLQIALDMANELYENTDLSRLNAVKKVSDDIFNTADILIMGAEISKNIYDNYRNNASDMKIAWDATVDLSVLGLNFFTTTYVVAGVTGMTAGIPGILAGVAVGARMGIVLDYTGDKARKALKGWVN